MKLHTLSPHESRMYPIDFGVQSSTWRLLGIGDWKWFSDHNWLCNPPMIIKFHTLALYESTMCPINFKVKRSRSWGISDWKWFRTKPVYVIHLHVWSWNFIHLLLMSQGCALMILGSNVLGNWGLKIVKICHAHSKGFCNSAFCIFDAPFTFCQFKHFIVFISYPDTQKTFHGKNECMIRTLLLLLSTCIHVY